MWNFNHDLDGSRGMFEVFGIPPAFRLLLNFRLFF